MAKAKTKKSTGKPVLRGRGKAGDIKTLKRSLKRRAGSEIQNVPADGITVRFLTEPEEGFHEYYEHFDDTREGSFYYPCTENDEGCQDGDKPTKRFLANAVDVDEKKVIALKLPQSLASQLVKKYDRFGTLMDRDYFLSKDGTGFDTTYDATPEAPSKMKLDKYELFDLEAILQSIVSDDDDDDDDEPVRKGKTKKAPVKVKRQRQRLDEDADDDDEDEPPRRRKVTATKKAVRKPLQKAAPAKKVIKKRK